MQNKIEDIRVVPTCIAVGNAVGESENILICNQNPLIWINRVSTCQGGIKYLRHVTSLHGAPRTSIRPVFANGYVMLGNGRRRPLSIGCLLLQGCVCSGHSLTVVLLQQFVGDESGPDRDGHARIIFYGRYLTVSLKWCFTACGYAYCPAVCETDKVSAL
ncbi:hypothetical protein [Paludibacterium sp. B53371]|uniref:hypothetical protein n=1 Tax=Paludibacterium sp. B53371 TaxID=2806263 RepID=UPI001C047275|nr:hypothetical protein [Paludibacterium sp. B53371]